MVAFQPKAAIVNYAGDHVRYVPAAMAHAMVASGTAAPQTGAGNVRAVSLTRPASIFAERIGEPTALRVCASIGGSTWSSPHRAWSNITRRLALVYCAHHCCGGGRTYHLHGKEGRKMDA
jgi:hypothetical protein